MKKVSRAIRHLKHNATKGNIAALFQLYENYEHGKNVEKDKKLAHDYLSQCIEALEDPKTKPKLELKRLSQIDFRGFSDLDLHLNSKLTVLIGDNGIGKISIADSIVKTISWIVAGIEKEGKNGKPINYNDINVNSSHYAEISNEFTLGTLNTYKASLSRAVKGAKEGKDSFVQDLRAISNLYRVANSRQEINLPLFAFYSVERSISKSSNTYSLEKLGSINYNSRFDAYSGALDGSGRFTDFLEWFIVLDNLANAELNLDNSELLNEIKILEDAINKSPQEINQQETNPLRLLLEQKRKYYTFIYF